MNGLSVTNAAHFEMGQLPSIPQVLLKLIDACHKVEVSFDELADIIQQDVGLSAKIVAVANSPAYAQWNDVKDFNRLLVVLGLNTIKTIAVTSAVHQFFSQFNPEVGKWMGRFWRSSLTCAHSARLLARLTGYEPMDEAYLAGLLHKVGQLVFLRKEPAGYREMLIGVHSLNDLDQREREMFGATYSEVGAFLTQDWDPDSFLSDSILYQHEPAEAVLDTPRLVKLVNFAYKLSERGMLTDDLHAEADLLFGLSQPVMEDLIQEVEASVSKAAEGLGIKLEDPGEPDGEFNVDTEDVRLQLARKVREFALLEGAQQHLAHSEGVAETLDAVLQDMKILFGLSNGVCFLKDPESEKLRAASGNCAPINRIREFSISQGPGRSLVAEALSKRVLLSSFDQAPSPTTPSVVDGQLAKLLGREGILCLPLYTDIHDIGVLVAGVNGPGMEAIKQQEDLLTYFAAAAANTFHQRQLYVSNRKEAIEQEQERQQRRVSKLVHEANNPLAIITNYLQVMSVRLGEDDAVQEQLTILNEEIERVANIVLRMRDVATPSELPQGVVDINTLIEDLLGIFRVSHFATRNIREHLNLDKAMPPILSNRNSLKQILTNLLKNAVEALPRGGDISLLTRDQVNVNGVQFIELTIADNGPGISKEILTDIFSPVRSTKGRDHSGLGLTITKNLVSDLAGNISCRNKKSGGAEFVVLLPRVLEH